MSVLAQEDIERFRRDGYLKFGQVIGMEAVESLRDALERTMAWFDQYLKTPTVTH